MLVIRNMYCVFLLENYFMIKKVKFHEMRLTIVLLCAKFNYWKLMTSLFLFFMRIVEFYVDNILVQRIELWLILKII